MLEHLPIIWAAGVVAMIIGSRLLRHEDSSWWETALVSLLWPFILPVMALLVGVLVLAWIAQGVLEATRGRSPDF